MLDPKSSCSFPSEEGQFICLSMFLLITAHLEKTTKCSCPTAKGIAPHLMPLTLIFDKVSM